MDPTGLTSDELSRLRDLLREAAILTGSLAAATSPAEVERLAVSAGAQLGGGASLVLSYDPGSPELRIEESIGLPPEAAKGFRFAPTGSFALEAWGCAARGEEPDGLRGALRSQLGFKEPVTHPIAVPEGFGPSTDDRSGEPFRSLRGLWIADARALGSLSACQIACLRQFGASVSCAVAAAIAQAPGRRAGQIDPLTGLYDRRFAENQLRRELARARRSREPLSMVLIDLDRFDGLNERHGYACGDRVLREIARFLVGFPNAGREISGMTLCFRETDVASRHGLDSFLIILPATPQPGAYHAAERFLAGLRNHRFTASAGGPELASLTGTAAVVTYPDDGGSAEALTSIAEALVAAASQAGGDRVVLPAPAFDPMERIA